MNNLEQTLKNFWEKSSNNLEEITIKILTPIVNFIENNIYTIYTALIIITIIALIIILTVYCNDVIKTVNKKIKEDNNQEE